jgi:hypothetical protein
MKYIEIEKERLISEAERFSITREDIERLINENNVNDFYIENIKIRLGIKEVKPERRKRSDAKTEELATNGGTTLAAASLPISDQNK